MVNENNKRNTNIMKNYQDFDPWEHFEDEGVVKMKPPKVKKVKKEKENYSKKKKR